MIKAFGRVGYARYDELGDPDDPHRHPGQRRVRRRPARNLRIRAHHDVKAAAKALQGFDGIGRTGADIFLREIQDVWTWAQPYFDDLALAAAKDLGLPTDAGAQQSRPEPECPAGGGGSSALRSTTACANVSKPSFATTNSDR